MQCFNSVQNYTTLKLIYVFILVQQSFNSVQNYTTLKHMFEDNLKLMSFLNTHKPQVSEN